jgi:hypothetical protein
MSANLRQILTLVFIAAGPIAWIFSEIFARPLIRRICGVFALCSVLLVGILLGIVQDMRLNSTYSGQTHELLKAAVDSLHAGKSAQVLQALETASTKLNETYEDSHYLEITKEAIDEMKR